MSQRETRPKKVVTAQQKGEGRAKQKKKRMKGRKHERGRARRQESSILTKT